MPAAELTDSEIAARCASGELLDDIGRSDSDDPKSLLNRCVALHNAGEIDLLSLTNKVQFDLLAGHEFFDRQHFFNNAIPRLEAPSSALMEAVKALVTKGGDDLAANLPNAAFREWCSAKPERARAIIAAAQTDDVQAINFVTFALVALGDANLARSFVSDFSDTRRLSGMFALSQIQPIDHADAKATIESLLPFLENTNAEASRCNALQSILQVCARLTDLAPTYLPEAIARAIVAPPPGLLYNLAQGVAQHQNQFDRSSLQAALDALKTTDPSMKGTIREIDFALKNALAGADSDIAESSLTEIVASGVDVKELSSTCHEITNGDQSRLFRLVVRWLTSGNITLEAATSKILRGGDEPAPFDTSTDGLALTGPDHILLARKAIGWLFANSVVAASVLVSCLRSCDSETADIIGKLLFDPLVLNFSGKAYEYLKSIKDSDPAYHQVQKALGKTDDYIANLKIEPPIKELRPSEHQRNIVRRRDQEWMREIQKSAQKQSVFFNLVHRSVLLYGNRSTTYVQDSSGQRKPISMELASIAHSFEFPRSDIIDPVGFSMMILSFRSARRP